MGVLPRWEELAGGRQAFEEGVTMLLAMVYPGLRHVDGSGGDRGEDAVLLLQGGGRHVFQVKSFTGRLKPVQRRQVEGSLKRAAEGEPTRWTLVVPLRLTPQEWDWFDGLRDGFPFPLDCHDLNWLNTKSCQHPAIDALFQPEAPLAALLNWPRVADTSPIDAGLAVPESGDIPPYVARDIDPVVRDRMRAAAESGGALVLVGDSAAGKTRTLYEALCAELPGHRLVHPMQPGDVPLLIPGIIAAAGPCVLWLDELHRYLEDGRCLTPHGLGELRRARAIVLATLDASAHEHWHGSPVLRQMQTLVLDRRWSLAERQRAAAAPDSRVVQAATADPAIGVAECLAAGPWLWQELKLADRAGGQPRGAAMIRAGIDLVRVGLAGPLSTSRLLEAHLPYLADSGGPVLRPEPADDALSWAGKVRFGVSSMLLPAGEDAWTAHPQLAAAADEDSVTVHPFTWFQALGAAGDLDDMFKVALNASTHAPSIGVFLWRSLADAGLNEAANNLGVTLADLGRHEEAEHVFRTQANPEDAVVLLNLGNLLCKTGRHEEAEEAYRKSGARGQAKAWNNLGLLLKDRGEYACAETCLHSAALAGAPDAEYNLGVLLDELGRADEAKAAYARAYDAGDASSLTNWGMLLLEEGRWTEAEPLLRQAAETGDGDAIFCLANAEKAKGNLLQATRWYRRAINIGDARACFNLANLHQDDDRPDLAEPLYREAIDAGITSALYNLALLLKRQKRLTEAEDFLRRAAAEGHKEALFHLGDVLCQTDRQEEATAQWKAAAEAGDPNAAIALATVLTDPADQPYLRKVLRCAADAGDNDAALLMSVLNATQASASGE
ncbi:tetratricopeptide repeat protein [Streptomyces sp. MB09-01]|uniref:tetratricopeptide repeat protein n=1 Tax=Streptomyces sp. MB09-01 TaxID=3028666 RepID=UPI0029A826D9|nr:tetratricopeptide repeat protein [Streptomyces sp. MB09-01]MDX3533553.1 tetratricopeptide repeat protein [Streptomyces sp. MB09-01]